MHYDFYNQEFFTKNRRLVLNEYDNDGNLIEERKFENEDLARFLSIMNIDHRPLEVARHEHLSQFTKDELNLISRCISHMELCASCFNDYEIIYLDTDEDVEYYKKLLKLPKEKIDLALDLSHPQLPGFSTSSDSPYYRKKFNFNEALEFIDERSGIYYTVTNRGQRRWDFIDKPTLKQYRYQLNKNGERTVFLSFKDWKEYIVTESDLTE